MRGGRRGKERERGADKTKENLLHGSEGDGRPWGQARISSRPYVTGVH